MFSHRINAVLISAAATLLLVAPAAAHVSVTPAAVPAGRTTTLRIEVPPLPSGARAETVALVGDGLEQLGRARARLPGVGGGEAAFEVRVRVDAGPGPLGATLRIVYPGGAPVLVPQTLTVTPAEPPRMQLGRALVAAAVGALALAAFAAWRFGRRRPAR